MIEEKNNSVNVLDINLNNLSPSLINYLQTDSDINDNIKTDWVPPKFHGLNNSLQIIPQYYKKCGDKILKIDYYEMIIDDIRNCRKLNEYQLNFIKKLDDERKHKLFLEFNNLFDVIETLLNN